MAKITKYSPGFRNFGLSNETRLKKLYVKKSHSHFSVDFPVSIYVL